MLHLRCFSLLTGLTTRYRFGRSFWLVSMAWLLGNGQAVAQDSTLTRLIRKNSFPLVAAGTQFSGTGWARLTQEVDRSQLVLLGEMHGTTQIPLLTAALAQVLRPQLFVAEISPYEAQDLTQLAAQPGPPATYLKEHPMALSFYTWSAEFALARQLLGQQVRLLGIDQVNLFSTSRFYASLAQQTTSKAARFYFQQRAQAYQAHDRAVMATDPSKLMMFQLTQPALDSLFTLTRKDSPTVRQMVQDYLTSYRIYQGQLKGTGGHQERVNLMKHNLLQELRAYQPTAGEPLPKMLFKLGDEHLARNLSHLGVFDVGNLVVNLADAQNQRSLHIMVMGKQGTVSGGFDPNDASKNVEAYTPATLPYLKLFYDQTAPGSWSVVDLRPARRALLSHHLQVADPTLERALLGYDFLVIIPETTANPAF